MAAAANASNAMISYRGEHQPARANQTYAGISCRRVASSEKNNNTLVHSAASQGLLAINSTPRIRVGASWQAQTGEPV